MLFEEAFTHARKGFVALQKKIVPMDVSLDSVDADCHSALGAEV
jgi:hypothetical protein